MTVSERSFLLLSIVSASTVNRRFILINILYAGIGCAGQINVAQNEDFDKWAIEILVKFRDEERLQPLTAERQSGGVSSNLILFSQSLPILT